MKKVSEAAFKTFLTAAGVNRGDNLFVHSSLGHLGALDNTRVEEIPQTLTRWLKDAVGGTGGVFMPNYAYSFPRSREADLRIQPSEVGILTEWFRRQPATHVSGHPMFSVAGCGATAYGVCQPDVAEFAPFSSQSAFQRLYDSDALMLFLGIDLAYATFMVFCEKRIGVRYRFEKPFKGKCTLQTGETVFGAYSHFCYPLEGNYHADFADFQRELLDTGVIRYTPMGIGKVFAIRMSNFMQQVEAYLQRKPFGLLSQTPDFFCRFEDGTEVRYPVTDTLAPSD